MSAEIINQPKSPFSSRILDISTLVLTFNLLWMISLLDATQLKWVATFFLRRGALPYLIVYFVLRFILAIIIAKIQKTLPAYYFRQLFAFSLFPLLFGIIGFIQGLTGVVSGAGHLFAYGMLEELKASVSDIFLGFGIAFDSLFLGLWGTAICLALYIQSLSSSKKVVQQAGPGYPPQGVGSPDP